MSVAAFDTREMNNFDSHLACCMKSMAPATSTATATTTAATASAAPELIA